MTGRNPQEEAKAERMNRDDTTLSVDEDGKDREPRVASQQTLLYSEAQRLVAFRRQHINRQNETPCPECATPVSIQAKKCPHCGSDIAEHTDSAREALEQLNHVTEEITALHAKELARHAEDSRARPLQERLGAFFCDGTVQQDLNVLAPAALLFFSVVVTLRVTASGLVFWLVAALGGSLAYALLRRSQIRHYLTVDLYRTVLFVGLGLVVSSAIFRPLPLWPASLAAIVEVKVPAANLRQAASTQSKVVDKLERGERLRVVDRNAGWFGVKTEDGTAGWIYANLVE